MYFQLLDLSELSWDIPYVEGEDMRRMACRICGKQYNQKRFFNMIEHLEKIHHKYQVSRGISIDDYVKFGCAVCNEKQFTDVHMWGNHFADLDNYWSCEGIGVVFKVDKPKVHRHELRDRTEDQTFERYFQSNISD